MHNLEPELYSLSLLKSFISFSMEYRQKSGDNRQIGIHIKLDTGMHRLGFEDADLPELADLLKQTSWITVKTVFSHLSASDNPAFDDFTREQICRYELMYGQLTEMLGYKPWRHILNSGGISRYPEYHWEMVRLGIGLYGVDGSNIIQERLHTVSTLKAEVSQVKYVQKGETVGYNRSGKAERDLIIATISIGYADGFSRSLSNGKGQVVIRGRKAPVIGNVCMDMTMIDVTDIPNVAAGDEVLIFGKEQPVQEFSAMLGTIPYEVFTNISSRVRRVVYQE
jgi:alanine racemase